MRPRILLVEDSPEIQELVKRCLAPAIEVETVDTVSGALALVEERPRYDLFLLDVMLGDGDGFALITLLRQRPRGCEVPVIFLTAKTDISDKARGFQLGAEDYIVKPFHPTELRLRVETRLQKLQAQREERRLVRGPLTLELAQMIALVDGRNLGLTPLEFKILHCLASHSDAVSRDTLMTAAWGAGVKVGRSLDTHVNSLRNKLGAHSGMIVTLYGVGYRFVLPG